MTIDAMTYLHGPRIAGPGPVVDGWLDMTVRVLFLLLLGAISLWLARETWRHGR